MIRGGGIGIALENNCAIEFIDDKFRVLNSKKQARAYRVCRTQGQVVAERVRPARRLTPIEFLFDRR